MLHAPVVTLVAVSHDQASSTSRVFLLQSLQTKHCVQLLWSRSLDKESSHANCSEPEDKTFTFTQPAPCSSHRHKQFLGSSTVPFLRCPFRVRNGISASTTGTHRRHTSHSGPPGARGSSPRRILCSTLSVSAQSMALSGSETAQRADNRSRSRHCFSQTPRAPHGRASCTARKRTILPFCTLRKE